jgi:SAM-dependent methyltransferase
MMGIWPRDFGRVRDEAWVRLPVEELAERYDSVDQHGWYDNLNPTIDRIANSMAGGERLVDYSGGTGILLERLLKRMGDKKIGALIADSSPKFLRLAYEKFQDDERVAFRRLHYLKTERRLERLDEVIEPTLLKHGFDVLVSTNAIHLYYDLDDTLASWRRSVRKRGRIYIQSGNISNPNAPEGTWIIDETVSHIDRIARELVRARPEFKDGERFLGDAGYLSQHDVLRDKYFLPARPLEHYTTKFEAAQLHVTNASYEVFPAKVSDWHTFLSVYHEGVLGWLGGAEKVTGKPADPRWVEMRKEIMGVALDQLFDGRETFEACWTYLDAVRTALD